MESTVHYSVWRWTALSYAGIHWTGKLVSK